MTAVIGVILLLLFILGVYEYAKEEQDDKAVTEAYEALKANSQRLEEKIQQLEQGITELKKSQYRLR